MKVAEYICGLFTLTYLTSARIQLNLYYEPLCGGCQEFITQQLGKNYDKFGKYLDVKLNPYGNTVKTGKHEFECQHGPEECKAAKMEGCLIHKTKDSEDQSLTFKLINCIETNDPANINVTRQCMTTLGIESPTFDEVLECATGAEGNKLFAQFGEETDALIPPHQYTPWIVFNNKWDQRLQDEAGENLAKALCDNFLQDIPECKEIWKELQDIRKGRKDLRCKKSVIENVNELELNNLLKLIRNNVF